MICRNSHQFAKTLLLVSIAVIVVVASTATPAVASGTFQRTESMNVARKDHTATLLSNGEVLVAGGVISGAMSNGQALVSGGNANSTTKSETSRIHIKGPEGFVSCPAESARPERFH